MKIDYFNEKLDLCSNVEWEYKESGTKIPVQLISTADRAGIGVDDIILSVDGKPATELEIRDFSDSFREIGQKIKLEVFRKETVFSGELVLNPLL